MIDVVLPDDIADLTKADLMMLDITAPMLDRAVTTCQRYVREELPGSPERLVWIKRVGVLLIARRLFDDCPKGGDHDFNAIPPNLKKCLKCGEIAHNR